LTRNRNPKRWSKLRTNNSGFVSLLPTQPITKPRSDGGIRSAIGHYRQAKLVNRVRRTPPLLPKAGMERAARND
jgi:hypothetical protein